MSQILARIDPRTTMGLITLTTAHLERALEFYVGRLGLVPTRDEGEISWLGAEGVDLVGLVEDRAARRARGTAGLYHFALLVPDRAGLGRMLRRLMGERIGLQGAADHLVSEALYLADPEGNGIEIYRDRPRAEWRHDGDSIVMATDPLDLKALLAAGDAAPATAGPPHPGLPAGTAMGHVHLQVGAIAAAEAFFHEGIGFDLTLRFGRSASFLSAGGYHHHVAVNTWAGEGASPAPPGALGLRDYVIRVPDADELRRVTARLEAIGHPVEATPRGALARDPSGNVARLVAAA